MTEEVPFNKDLSYSVIQKLSPKSSRYLTIDDCSLQIKSCFRQNGLVIQNAINKQAEKRRIGVAIFLFSQTLAGSGFCTTERKRIS